MRFSTRVRFELCERYWPGKGGAPDAAPDRRIARLTDLAALLA